MDSVAERIRRRFQKSVSALEKALALPELPERADRDAILLRFELAAELMPKVLQRALAERGADIALPKDAVRAACAADVIDESAATVLLSIIDDRNRMVHDYSEEYAAALLNRVRNEYIAALHASLRGLQKS